MLGLPCNRTRSDPEKREKGKLSLQCKNILFLFILIDCFRVMLSYYALLERKTVLFAVSQYIGSKVKH